MRNEKMFVLLLYFVIRSDDPFPQFFFDNRLGDELDTTRFGGSLGDFFVWFHPADRLLPLDDESHVSLVKWPR